MTNRWVAIARNVAIVAAGYSLLALGMALYLRGPNISYLSAWRQVAEYYAVFGELVAAIVAFATLSHYSPHTGTRLTDSDSGMLGTSHSQEGLPMNGGLDSNGTPYGMDRTTMGD